MHATSPYHNISTFVATDKGGVSHTIANKASSVLPRSEEMENGFPEGRLTIDLSVSSSPVPHSANNGHQRSVGQYSLLDNHQNIVDLNILQQQLIAVQQQQAARLQTGALPTIVNNPHAYNNANFISNHPQPASNNCLSPHQQLVQQLLFARALAATQQYSYLANVPTQQLYLSLSNLMSSVDACNNVAVLPQQQQQPMCGLVQQNSSTPRPSQQTSINGPLIHSECSNSAGNSRGTPNSSMTSPNGGGGGRPTSATVLSPEVLEQHINRLISENDAMLESSPMLTKRRSYTSRQHHGGSLDYSTMTGGHQQQQHQHRSLTNGRGCRSQSLIETSSPPCLLPQNFLTNSFLASASSSNVPISEIAAAAPSTSSSVNQALNFHAQVESATLEAMDKLYNCTYCHLAIRHLDELKRHEEKCARRDEFCTNVATKFFSRDEQSGSKCGGSVLITDANLSVISENKRSAVASPIIENKHPLKKRILAAEFAQKPPKDEATFRPVVAPLSAASNSLSFSANKIVAQPDHVAKVTCALTSVSQSFVDAGPKFIASDAYLQVIPKVSLSTSERLGILRPYCVTVEIRDQNPLEPTKSGRKPHQVTQTTNSASLRRITPSVDWQSTEYAHWPQIVASPLESKLNIMLMDGFVTKCRPPYLHYTVADKDLNLMHATHSSNWSYSKTRFPYVATTSSPSTKTSVDAAVPKLSPTASSVLVLEPEAISSSEKSNCDAVSSIESDDDVLRKTGNKHTIAVVPIARSCQPIVSTFKDDGSTILEKSTYSSTNVATVGNFENPDSCKTNTVAVAVCTTIASSSSLSRELLKNILTSNSHHQSVKKVTVCNGGYKTNEAYTYVRGRGRGRYVCARCGIRCKKPSMLKKHIRTHLNVRPYSCAQCMFSFKTKGNLTKHLKSKSHSKKCASLQSNDDDGTDSKNDLNASMDMLDDDTDETLTDDDPENMSDDEMETIAQQVWQHGSNPTNELRQRACSFKNVWNRVRTGMYFDRQVRTPPLDAFSTISDDFSCDRCDSAPPCLMLDTLSTDILPPEHQIPLSSASTIVAPSAITSIYSEAKNALFYNNCEASSNSSLLQHQKLVATSSIMDSGVQNFTPTTNNNYLNCLLTPEGKTKCEICGEEFLKFGLLKLHMYTHVVEQSNRRQSDKCPYCNSSFRSKNVLQKHLLHAHPQQSQHYANSNAATPSSSSSMALQSALEISSKVGQPADDRGVAAQHSTLLSANVSPNLMTSSSSSSSGTNNKPRPFECRDCDKSFRIHGHLAKHLRSKSHIMQLECLEKVPIGTFAKLEESNCDYFTDIDTSDSENSLKSLLKLAQKLMTSSPSTTPTKEHIRVDNLTVDTTICQSSNRSLSVTAPVNHLSPAIVANNNGSTVVSSLTCTEELRPSPSPSPKKHFVDNKTSTLGGARTVVADVWIPPKETVVSASGVPELRQASVNNHVINATFAKPLYVRQQDATSLPPSCVSAKQTSDAASTANVGVVSDVKPLKSETFCNFCSIDFPSVIELEIHWHADHIFMRDGNNFKCPKANCDTVYPSKRDLRNHLSSHYYGTFDNSVDSASTPTGSSCSSGDVSKATVVALSRKINNSVASVGANCNNPPSNSNASSFVQDSPSPSDAYSRRVLFEKTKTHVVKLKFGNTLASNETSGPSADSSPISDSDASRASVGSQSLSPAQQNFASIDRHLLKRHSSEDFVSFVPSKRLIMEDMAQRSYANAKEASDFMLRNTTPSGVTSFSQQQQQTSFACTTPSPLAIPVPVVAQRPPAPLWTSFVNNCVGGQSSPQGMYLTAAAAAAALPVQNSAAAFLGLTHPAAFLAAVQQNAKFFNAAWPSPFALNNSSLNHNGGGVQQVFNQPLIGQQVFVSGGGGGGSNPGHHHESLSSPNAFFLDQLRCIYCQKQCHSLVSLQEHLMSHAQPRSHVCKFCDAAFTTAQALQAHTPCRMQKCVSRMDGMYTWEEERRGDGLCEKKRVKYD